MCSDSDYKSASNICCARIRDTGRSLRGLCCWLIHCVMLEKNPFLEQRHWLPLCKMRVIHISRAIYWLQQELRLVTSWMSIGPTPVLACIRWPAYHRCHSESPAPQNSAFETLEFPFKLWWDLCLSTARFGSSVFSHFRVVPTDSHDQLLSK